MDETALSEMLTQSISFGVAVVELDTWRIRFENARFSQWFSPTIEDDENLAKRISGFNAQSAQGDIGNGRTHDFETTISVDDYETPLRIEIRALPSPTEDLAVVECLDISAEREMQYMLQAYSKITESNAEDINREKERTEKLLLNVMPQFACDELREYGSVTPKRFDKVTVMMIDFVNFTQMTIAMAPDRIVTELNDIFTAIDRMSEIYGCDRIKTIGDAYLAVCGLMKPDPRHAHNIAHVALRVRHYLERRNISFSEPWKCRIGISSQPVVGAVVGVQKYAYDIFGPGVNLAARMENESNEMEITVSEDTYSLLRNDFTFEELGEVEIKGFGPQKLYRLEGEKSV